MSVNMTDCLVPCSIGSSRWERWLGEEFSFTQARLEMVGKSHPLFRGDQVALNQADMTLCAIKQFIMHLWRKDYIQMKKQKEQ